MWVLKSHDFGKNAEPRQLITDDFILRVSSGQIPESSLSLSTTDRDGRTSLQSPPPPVFFIFKLDWISQFSLACLFSHFRICLFSMSQCFSCMAPHVSQRSEGGARSSGAGDLNGYGPPCGCSHLTPILCKHKHS